MKNIQVAFAVFLLCVCCTKEETSPRLYPRVLTNSVTDITSEGARFHAEIIFSSTAIIDHGFVWSKQSNLTLATGEKISLGPKPDASPFETPISRGLREGVKYYVKAYAKSGDYTVYGNVVEFESLGSLAPAVENFNPSVGMWGDTIIITGKNFSDISSNISVKLGTVKASVIETSIDKIKVVTPVDIVPGKYNFYVDAVGNTSASNGLFELIQAEPSITTISSDTVVVGDVLSITGKNFNPNYNAVKLNGINLTGIGSYNNSVTFKIPGGIANGNVTLSLSVLDKTVFANSPIIKPRHKISSVTPMTAFHGDIIKIHGNYFPINISFVKVFIGGLQAQIVAAARKELEVKVPDGIPINSSITVLVEEQAEEYAGFKRAEMVIHSVTPNEHINPGDVVTVSGDNFGGSMIATIDGRQQTIYSVTRNSFQVRIWSAQSKQASLVVSRDGEEATSPTPLKFPLTVKLDKALYSNYSGVYFSSGTKAYYGFGQYNGLWDGFGSYDPSTNSMSWIPTGSVPRRYDAISFYLNGQGFVGGGGTYSAVYSDFWRFDPATNGWSYSGELPLQAKSVGWFTTGNKSYCMFYDPNGITSKNPVYEYDAVANSWTKKKDFTGTTRAVISDWDSRHAQFFEFNGKYFMLGGVKSDRTKIAELWSYDPSTDEWNQVPLSIDPGYAFLIVKSRNRIFLVTTISSEQQKWFEFNSDFSFQLRNTIPKMFSEHSFSMTINNTGWIFSPLSYSCYEFDPDF